MDEKIQKIYNRTLELIQRQLNARLKGRKSEPIEMGLIRLFEICNRISKSCTDIEIDKKNNKFDFGFLDDDDDINYENEFHKLSESDFKSKYGEYLYAQLYSKNLLEQTQNKK